MQADEIMVDRVASVAPTDTVGLALEVLAGIEARHLPVVEEGQVGGMLSDRDLRSLGVYPLRGLVEYEEAQALVRTPVSRVMSADVHTVGPGTELREVIDVMLTEKIGAVPVVDPSSGSLVGIVSYVDVLRAAANMFED